MKEDLLHFVWRTKRFDLFALKTTEGEPIQIQSFGEHNTHSGPDFFNAKIKIGDTLWAGNVEMHLNSSDWNKHHHSNDRAYDNVILHVVLEEDEPIFRKSGERIPALELKKRISEKLSKTYLKLLHNEYWIPCQHHFFEVSEMKRNIWLDRLLVERLESKTNLIHQQLQQNKQHWEETFYQFLARNFGVKVNNDAFEQLARATPLIYISKHKNDLFQIEAMLFGQAGMLEEEFEDDYPNRLKKEYHFLKTKYKLEPIDKVNWKFMRLRPANFPTIRIAQFAQLIFQSAHLFSKILEAENVEALEKLFKIEPSDYWKTHYTFDNDSEEKPKRLGKTAIHLFIINTIAPFLFVYGTQKAETAFQDKALSLLESLKPEKNSIINGWKDLGVMPESAAQTQALLQLKNEYCNQKRCLECSVGAVILK